MKYSILVSVLFLFSGCWPMYSTEYIYTAPKSQAALACIDNCKDYENGCKQEMQSSKENCEYDNQRLMDDCNEKIEREKNRGSKWHECGRQITCDFPESRCESEYRECYRSCGGKVDEITTCVANCENEQPKKK